MNFLLGCCGTSHVLTGYWQMELLRGSKFLGFAMGISDCTLSRQVKDIWLGCYRTGHIQIWTMFEFGIFYGIAAGIPCHLNLVVMCVLTGMLRDQSLHFIA